MAGLALEASIDKLTSDNYSSWCEDAKVLLMDRNAWTIVTGTEREPAKDADPKEKRDYATRKAKAYSTIYLSIEKRFRPLISGTDDGKQAWEILLNYFRPDSRARIIGLMDQFFSCRILEDESIGLFAARLRAIVDQLSDAGKPISSWFHSFQLIRFLHPKFSGIVQTIYRWSDTEFTPEKVLQELLAEESRLQQSVADYEITALHSCSAKSKTVKSKYRGGKIRKRKCFLCGETDHLIANCKKKTIKDKDSLNDSIKQKQASSYIVETCYNVRDKSKTTWVFDTAASAHFCCNRNLFTTLKAVSDTSMAVAVDDISCPVEGIGTVKMQFTQYGIEDVILNNVMYSPRLRRNLISGSLIEEKGGSFTGKGGKIIIHAKDGRKTFHASRKNGLYYVYPKYPKKTVLPEVENFIILNNDLELWHRRFCHINTKYIVSTSKNNSVRDLPEFKNTELNCESCRLAKSRRVSYKPISKVRSDRPLQLLHLDVCGPLPTQTREGYKYFLTIIDDYSRKVTVYPLKQKSEVFECFTKYQKRAERFLNLKVVNVRTDNGLEFINEKFEKFLEEQGIKGERTNVYTPQQNGVSERYNYTAMNAVRVLLKASSLSNGFWVEALFCFTYVWNRICHYGQNKTPFELYGGRKPSVKHLREFGATAYVGTPKQLRNKLGMQSKKGILVGYAMKTKGYRIWLPTDRKVIETINVRIEEKCKSSGDVLDPSKLIYQLEPDSDSESQSDYSVGETEEKFDPKESPLSTPTEVKIKHEVETPPYQAAEPEREVTWVRTAVPRKDNSRIDILYKIEGTDMKLRCYKDVETYCNAHGLKYNKSDFNFSGKDTYSGVVQPEKESNLSDI
jgi:hypothetical protein